VIGTLFFWLSENECATTEWLGKPRLERVISPLVAGLGAGRALPAENRPFVHAASTPLSPIAPY